MRSLSGGWREAAALAASTLWRASAWRIRRSSAEGLRGLDGPGPVRPLDEQLEAGPAVEAQRQVVLRLDAQLDSAGAAGTQLRHAPAQELAAQPAASPLRHHSDQPDVPDRRRVAVSGRLKRGPNEGDRILRSVDG